MAMKNQISKTLITRTEDLKIGDVIYIFERRQFEMNRKRAEPWPDCNYHRITVVRNVRKDSDGVARYDTEIRNKLVSVQNADAKIVNDLLDAGTILDNGTFGANHVIDQHRDVYRLNNIVNIRPKVYELANLVRNPGYDLMH